MAPVRQRGPGHDRHCAETRPSLTPYATIIGARRGLCAASLKAIVLVVRR
ncbi:hypothetical protein HYE68_008166 [Fusarium pseudograminearum]|uniref:Uncharacterized protein n=1 Tax=Fusarium pseudograminearum (strain CS3096) TaxID=1028729 RepID=K3VQ23_FUSPC|nr:hypothetical protein FPSE_03891 [Fusarium pseudograminearum CS3096]EKJ75943.1 hypothetical protein FPSE_03891 [Fusarium pseudograminearum CS3096]QPC77414.1 hypothetical protein HYE68_008166 [Fusarium pseudograminearum]